MDKNDAETTKSLNPFVKDFIPLVMKDNFLESHVK